MSRDRLIQRPRELVEAVERGELTSDQARSRRVHGKGKATHGTKALRKGVVARPLVRDVDLAKRLRYPVPRQIRRLVARLENAGKLGLVDWRTRRVRQSTGNGGTATFEVREAWLDETQALRVVLEGKAPGRDEYTAEAFAELARAYDRVDAASAHERPRTRGDCEAGPRPCPFVGCQYHLAIDISPEGSVVENFPGVQLEDLPFTCALDVADRGGASDEDVGAAMNLTREAVRQTVQRAFDAVRDGVRHLRVYVEPE